MKVLLELLFFMFPVCLFAQTNQDSTYKPVEYPVGFSAQLNVVYTRVNGWEGKVDLYLPPKTNKPTPVLINIHGGGWNHGKKEEQGGFSTFFKG